MTENLKRQVFPLHKVVKKKTDLRLTQNWFAQVYFTTDLRWHQTVFKGEGVFFFGFENIDLCQHVRDKVVGGPVLSLAVTRKLTKQWSMKQRWSQLLVVMPTHCLFRQLVATCLQKHLRTSSWGTFCLRGKCYVPSTLMCPFLRGFCMANHSVSIHFFFIKN